jgi:site-specific recombinase XerD
MLRMMDPQWPRPEPPRTAGEALQRELLEGYGRWVVEERGLSKETCAAGSERAKHFLCWLNPSNRAGLMDLSIAEIDAYLASRLPSHRRAGRHHVCHALRSFLRYLYSEHVIARDLSAAVAAPRRYEFEDIPRALPAQQVQAVIEHTRRDHSPIGRRDYAVLLLLATYGMRAKEVTELRLDDIDWRQERLRIRHSKTGYETLVPLVAPVGEALLNYLKHGRPPTTLRQVFLQAIAPYQPFSCGGSLCTVIRYRLQKAGIDAAGHQGAHAFRHARAHSLLRASVPIKAIGDLLGHRSPDSTNVYLKLATEDLRAVSLEIPERKKA